MTIKPDFSGFTTPDVASLVAGDGLLYRCYVWRNVIDNRIEALCKAELEDGQGVTVFHNVIEVAASTVQDSPKIVARGNFFHVIWIDVTATSESVSAAVLRKAWIEVINLHNVGAWTVLVPTIAIHTDCLFDIDTIHGDATAGYILTYKRTDTFMQVRRQASHLGFPSTDEVWNTSINIAIEGRVLGCYGSDTDNDVVVSYEPTGVFYVQSSRLSADAGTGHLAVQSFVNCGTFKPTALGHCRVASNRCAIVVEARDEAYTAESATIVVDRATQRWIGCREINTDDATRVNNEHRTWGMTLQSRPWSYAGHTGAGLNPNVYAVLGFSRPSVDDQEWWTQSSLFVCNLERSLWSSTSNRSRARPMAKMVAGDCDARDHSAGPPLQAGGIALAGLDPEIAQARCNHISHVSGAPPLYSPDYKTRTWAGIVFSTQHVSSDDPRELAVSTAAVVGHRYHMEEPWVRSRDPSEPSTPTSNFLGAYPLSNYQTLQVGRGIFGNGGVPWTYAGKQKVECGFLWAPDIYASDGGAGALAAGTYSYFAIYTWRDEAGQLHRSTPSVPVSLTLAASHQVNLRIRTITLTMKEQILHYPMVKKIAIEVYRTAANGTVYYRLFGDKDGSGSAYELRDTPPNLISDWHIVVLDNYGGDVTTEHDVAPWQLLNGQWVPLEPWQPPAFGPIEKWRNRIWGAATETDALELWYSLELGAEPGGTAPLIPEFNPVNVFRLDDIGAVTALKAMDNALFVFTVTDIYALTGNINDDTGVGQDLVLQKIPAEGNGCIEPRSVCLTPMGITFQSYKGIHLLNRSMQVEYIGQAVEDLVRLSGNIHRATLMEGRHAVYFIGNDAAGAVAGAGMVLAWNYLFGLWSKLEPADLHSIAWTAQLVDGCSWRGATGEDLHVILAFGGVAYEREALNANLYQDERHDGLVAIATSLRTGWIKMADLNAGIGRCWEIGIQLTKPSASAMQVIIDYEINGLYDASAQQTLTFTSPANPYLRCKTSTTKCTAIRVRVQESGSPTGEAVEYHSISFVLGVKPGLRRVPDTYMGS